MVASTIQVAFVMEACSYLAIVECTLVVIALVASAGFVRHLLDLRVLHQVACWVVHPDYCFLGYMEVVITGYILAFGIERATGHHQGDRGGPSYHSRR